MKLQTLEFKGFGPYTEPQTIEFPTARKVAVLGNNGAGKTFLLDAVPAALFKAVPNRKGGFYEQFSGNDAYIDIVFTMSSHTYRAKRLVNAVSRTQKAYLYKDGEPLNDGKDAAFAEAIQSLGLNETAFLAALYQTQNGVGNPLNMDVDSRIKLLSIILDLIRFEEDHKKAVEAHKEVAKTIEHLQQRQSEIANQMPDTEALKPQKQILEQGIVALDEEIAKLDEQIQHAIQSVADARANAQGSEYLKTQREQLQQQIRADEAAQLDKQERIKNNEELVINRAESIRQAVKDQEAATLKIQQLQDSITQNQEYANQAQAKLDQWYKDQRERAADAGWNLTEAQSQLMTLQAQLRDLEMVKAKHLSDKTATEGKINALRPSTEIIDRVPCQGLEINTSCELLQNAHANAHEIAQLAQHLTTLESVIPQAQEAIDQKKIEIQDQQSTVDALQDDVTAINAEQPPVEFVSALVDLNRWINSEKEEINVNQAIIQAAAPLAKFAQQLHGAVEKVAEYRQELVLIDERLNANRAAVAEIDQKLADTANLEAVIASKDEEKQQFQAQKKILEGKNEEVKKQVNQTETLLSRADELATRLNELKAEIAEQSAALADIQLLREGLGPKGAKNIKIDAAGKAITERANRLIRIGLGPQFSIIINTLRQLQSKDENGKPEVRETLELKIINNESGEEMLIENLSGGEKAMAGLVFTLSLAVEQREASGLDIQTLILDEPSAGLSEENSVKYLDMLDAVLDETGIQQVFFISHMPSMQNLADAAIYVKKGHDGQSSQVEVIK